MTFGIIALVSTSLYKANMKALSIRQPFAWLIMSGHKLVENRTWATRYRGPLLIHASLRPNHDAWDHIVETHNIAIPEELMSGCVIGQINLVTVVNAATARRTMPSQQEWINGPYCFVLRNPRPFATPIDATGQRGLFNLTLPRSRA
jgi:hypothetical protein